MFTGTLAQQFASKDIYSKFGSRAYIQRGLGQDLVATSYIQNGSFAKTELQALTAKDLSIYLDTQILVQTSTSNGLFIECLCQRAHRCLLKLWPNT